MIEDEFVIEMVNLGSRRHSRPRSGWDRRHQQEAEGFQCTHCRAYVSANHWLAGVHNRNHCPYCLWSRHMDLVTPGDRLAACREPMKPVGLALKRSDKKYGPGWGELMLVHECLECSKISLNRIAADDVAEQLLEIYQDSCANHLPTHLGDNGVRLLGLPEKEIVLERLFGADH
jgi:hypothetical protein